MLDVRVTDLTATGCRVEVAAKVTIGSCVTIGLTDSLTPKGWVAWAGDGAVGVDFAHRIPDEVVVAVIARR